MLRESAVEKPAVATLERHGWTVLKFGNIGFPDRIAIKGMKCFWLEFKTPAGQLTPAQKRRIPKLRKANQFVLIVDDFEKLRDALDYNHYPFNSF